MLVLNGDTLFELDLTSLIAFHRERDSGGDVGVASGSRGGSLGARRGDRSGPGHADHRPRSLPVTADDARGCLPVSIFCTRASCVHLPVGKESSIIDAYVQGIQDGERIMGYDFDGYWTDVGTPERYAQVERDAAAGLLSLSARTS